MEDCKEKMERIATDGSQVSNLVHIIKVSKLPTKEEARSHPVACRENALRLANTYFAIVSICHQTSPLGEKGLEGLVNNVRMGGWDYLEKKFLARALENPKWSSPDHWKTVTPRELSEMYDDPTYGKTLNRVNERTFLLNNLGHKLIKSGCDNIQEAFDRCGGIVGGDSGFLTFLKRFEAYKDPLMKKSQLFLAIMERELGWVIQDPENLLSPVDYHEMRGHLRIGTIRLCDEGLASKVRKGLTLNEEEDFEIRSKIQEVNSSISEQTGKSVSVIHSLFWNVFRSCCPRESSETHCSECGQSCGLANQYKEMNTYETRCLFSPFCYSAGKENKVIEPPYAGHYY